MSFVQTVRGAADKASSAAAKRVAPVTKAMASVFQRVAPLVMEFLKLMWSGIREGNHWLNQLVWRMLVVTLLTSGEANIRMLPADRKVPAVRFVVAFMACAWFLGAILAGLLMGLSAVISRLEPWAVWSFATVVVAVAFTLPCFLRMEPVENEEDAK